MRQRVELESLGSALSAGEQRGLVQPVSVGPSAIAYPALSEEGGFDSLFKSLPAQGACDSSLLALGGSQVGSHGTPEPVSCSEDQTACPFLLPSVMERRTRILEGRGQMSECARGPRKLVVPPSSVADS